MTVRVMPPDALVMLIERLRDMANAIQNGGALDHRRGIAAAKHFEFEIAPLLETLDASKITNAIVEAALAEHHRQNGVKRLTVPLNSGIACTIGNWVQITSRPHGGNPMRIERIVVPDDLAPYFKVHDISIVNRSQFGQAGAISATILAQNAPDARPFNYDVVPTAAEIVIVVEYIGPDEAGAEFMATAIGITGERRVMGAAEVQGIVGAGGQIPQQIPVDEDFDLDVIVDDFVDVAGTVAGDGTAGNPLRVTPRGALSAQVVTTVTPRR